MEQAELIHCVPCQNYLYFSCEATGNYVVVRVSCHKESIWLGKGHEALQVYTQGFRELVLV